MLGGGGKGYLHVDWHCVPWRQEDRSSVVSHGNEQKSLSTELWTKPMREMSGISNRKGKNKASVLSFFLFLNASCNIYCNDNLPPEGGHVTGVCWSAFHSCKRCVLDKIQQTQLVRDLIWFHITSHVMLYRYVRLFYWNSNRVRCSIITVLYFNNSSGHFKLKWLLLLCTIYL